MAAEYHDVNPESPREVYHNKEKCVPGSEITVVNKRFGKGTNPKTGQIRRLCEMCPSAQS
jgi:hypothetical protein